jgi:sister chromatid cohesion protein DCC1
MSLSTTTSTALPLTHALDGIGYKLIELPPELQAVLEGDAPPVLTLVSSPTSTAALLQTPDKTYSLRQKNTSNTLMLLCPTSQNPDTCNPQDNDNDVNMSDANTNANANKETNVPEGAQENSNTGAGTEADKNAEGGMDVVGKLHETVELVPEAKERPPVITNLKNTGSKGKWHERFGKNR